MPKREENSSVPITSRQRQIPGYGTVSLQLYEIGQESLSVSDFIFNVASTICNSCVLTTIFVVSTTSACLMCYVGLVYTNECPVKREIPMYLLVGGVVGLLQISLIVMRHRREHHDDLGDDTDIPGMGLHSASQGVSYSNKSSKVTELIVWTFLLIWFAFGNYWVLGIYKPPYKQHERSRTPAFWCKKLVYNFALFQISVTHVVLLIVVICCVSFACCATKYLNTNRPSQRSQFG